MFGAQIAYGAQISIITALVSLHFTFTPLTITITTVRVSTVEPPLKRLRIATILLVSSWRHHHSPEQLLRQLNVEVIIHVDMEVIIADKIIALERFSQ